MSPRSSPKNMRNSCLFLFSPRNWYAEVGTFLFLDRTDSGIHSYDETLWQCPFSNPNCYSKHKARIFTTIKDRKYNAGKAMSLMTYGTTIAGSNCCKFCWSKSIFLTIKVSRFQALFFNFWNQFLIGRQIHEMSFFSFLSFSTFLFFSWCFSWVWVLLCM